MEGCVLSKVPPPLERYICKREVKELGFCFRNYVLSLKGLSSGLLHLLLINWNLFPPAKKNLRDNAKIQANAFKQIFAPIFFDSHLIRITFRSGQACRRIFLLMLRFWNVDLICFNWVHNASLILFMNNSSNYTSLKTRIGSVVGYVYTYFQTPRDLKQKCIQLLKPFRSHGIFHLVSNVGFKI